MSHSCSGARAGRAPATMINIAKAMTEEEMRDAAEYFAKLKLMPWTKVVESDTVPKFYFGRGNMRLPVGEGGTEPLGNRIVELPEDPTRVATSSTATTRWRSRPTWRHPRHEMTELAGS